jgi:hypothetical protein
MAQDRRQIGGEGSNLHCYQTTIASGQAEFLNDTGVLRLSRINGARDKSGRRSVSSFRGGGRTPFDALIVRACSWNTEVAWGEDPVIAIAKAGRLRTIVDGDGRREICVYADSTDDNDPFGKSDSHASIRKSEPAHERHQRQDIAILRSKLFEAFAELRHLISGLAIE